MSLGLFNCRLIQPAGDQLFFFAGVLPVRASSVQSRCDPARPRPAGGRSMLLVFPSQKGFVWFFTGGEAPVGCRRFPPIQLRIPTKILNPTHRFCYRAFSRYSSHSSCKVTFLLVCSSWRISAKSGSGGLFRWTGFSRDGATVSVSRSSPH